MQEREYQFKEYKIIIKDNKLAIFRPEKDSFGNRYYDMVFEEYGYGIEKDIQKKPNSLLGSLPLIPIRYAAGNEENKSTNFEIIEFVKELIIAHEQLKFDNKMDEILK
jgi:hypothetical protein